MFWLLFLFCWIILWLIREMLPARYLKQIEFENILNQENDAVTYKLLDIRDASEYHKNSLPDSINISLGRLPFIWQKYLVADEYILILSDDLFKIKKAARILKNRGFKNLYFTCYVNRT